MSHSKPTTNNQKDKQLAELTELLKRQDIQAYVKQLQTTNQPLNEKDVDKNTKAFAHTSINFTMMNISDQIIAYTYEDSLFYSILKNINHFKKICRKLDDRFNLNENCKLTSSNDNNSIYHSANMKYLMLETLEITPCFTDLCDTIDLAKMDEYWISIGLSQENKTENKKQQQQSNENTDQNLRKRFCPDYLSSIDFFKTHANVIEGNENKEDLIQPASKVVGIMYQDFAYVMNLLLTFIDIHDDYINNRNKNGEQQKYLTYENKYKKLKDVKLFEFNYVDREKSMYVSIPCTLSNLYASLRGKFFIAYKPINFIFMGLFFDMEKWYAYTLMNYFMKGILKTNNATSNDKNKDILLLHSCINRMNIQHYFVDLLFTPSESKQQQQQQQPDKKKCAFFCLSELLISVDKLFRVASYNRDVNDDEFM